MSDTVLSQDIPMKATEGAQSRSLSSIASSVVHIINTSLPPGDLADLRRLTPSSPFSPAYFKLMLSNVRTATDFNHGSALETRSDKGWAVFFQVAATMVTLHQTNTSLGFALANSGYSELRLFRLLRSREETLFKEIRTCSHFLASKGQACDLVIFAKLLVIINPEVAISVRRSIANDYYGFASESREN